MEMTFSLVDYMSYPWYNYFYYHLYSPIPHYSYKYRYKQPGYSHNERYNGGI